MKGVVYKREHLCLEFSSVSAFTFGASAPTPLNLGEDEMAAPEQVLTSCISLQAQTCLEQIPGLPPFPDKAHPGLLQGAHWERRGSLSPPCSMQQQAPEASQCFFNLTFLSPQEKERTFHLMQKVHPDERTHLKEWALSFVPMNPFTCNTSCS